MHQILFKFWILTQLHAYFVLENSKKIRVGKILFFTTYLLPTYTFIWYLRVYGKILQIYLIVEIYELFNAWFAESPIPNFRLNC